MWKTEATTALPGLELAGHSRYRNGGAEYGDHARRDTHEELPLLGD
jgi:hypothetical protein